MSSTRRLLSELVGMDTTSRLSNLELVRFIEGLFDAAGVEHTRVMNADGSKANLLGRIGPDAPGGVVLSAHLDCVPVDGQPWSRDPFTLSEVDGKLHGRGTSDMKGFIAVALAALDDMATAGLQRPILFALSHDEEIGTVGAPAAVDGLLTAYARPRAVIVGEPTSMEVATAHKGVRSFRVTVEGLDGHSSQPGQASNAVVAAARIATFIDDLAIQHRTAAADDRFAPPYTTFNLATIAGGQAINIVPRHAELTFEYRPVPGDDSFAIRDRILNFIQQTVEPALRAGTGVGDVQVENLAVARSLHEEADGAAERLARDLTGYDGPGRTVAFATDGGHFQAAGLSTVVVGPGSIQQAHTPDEWVTIEQLRRCETFIERLIASLATG